MDFCVLRPTCVRINFLVGVSSMCSGWSSIRPFIDGNDVTVLAAGLRHVVLEAGSSGVEDSVEALTAALAFGVVRKTKIEKQETRRQAGRQTNR